MSFGFGAAAAPAPGGLFGSTSTPSFGAAAQPSGGLFGGSTQATQPSGGLFGSTQATQGSQPSFGFGQTTTTQQQQAPSFGSSFGAAPAPAFGGGGFSSQFGQQQPQQQQSGGFFSSTTGQQQQQQQQQPFNAWQQQQQQQYVQAVRETTLYEQLPVSGSLICKETVDGVQKHLDSQRLIAEQLRNAANVGEAARRLGEAVKGVRQVLSRAENDQRLARALSAELLDDAKRLKHEGDVLAAKFSTGNQTVELPPPVLWNHSSRCEMRLRQYAADVDRVARVVDPEGAYGDDQSTRYDQRNKSAQKLQRSLETPEDRLKRLLVAQNDAFMRVAALISEHHKRVEDLRSDFQRKKGGDVFRAKDKEDEAERKEIDNQIKADHHQQLYQQNQPAQNTPGTAFQSSTATTTTTTYPGFSSQSAAPAGGGLFGASTPGLFGSSFATTPAQPTLLSSTSRRSSSTRRGSTRKGK